MHTLKAFGANGKQMEKRNTGTEVNFINGKMEERDSDGSKVTQELATNFLLSVTVSITK